MCLWCVVVQYKCKTVSLIVFDVFASLPVDVCYFMTRLSAAIHRVDLHSINSGTLFTVLTSNNAYDNTGASICCECCDIVSEKCWCAASGSAWVSFI